VVQYHHIGSSIKAQEATMITTRVCELLGIQHPIVQAGMSQKYTNPELVAAVSNAGGLGILGCLNRTAEQAITDIRRIRELTDRPFGVNFVLHMRDDQAFAACLAEDVPIFSFFRGNPAEATQRAHAIGATVIHQITTVAEAQQACEVGVDVIVAQGHEAGGHNGPIPLNTLLPAVLQVVGTTPVLAAGGLIDGQDLAQVLRMGAAGMLMGTRFLATHEAPVSAGYKQALFTANGPGATIAAGMFDLLWGTEWPGVQLRTLQNSLTARWVGREAAMLAERDAVLAAIHAAEANDDTEEYGILAGAGAGRIGAVLPVQQLIKEIMVEAKRLV
jgi:NAD(P)H-dependent flavin oxidoreductase YrpB (nitropropane dioxygenase family)